MKNLSGSLALVALILAAGCTPLAVEYDYDTTFDFTRLRTYDWAPVQPAAGPDELMAKRFEQAVNDQLQKKGFTRSAGTPDFLVLMEGVRKTVTAGSVGVGASVAVPVGSHGAVHLGTGKSKPRVKQEGTISLDFKNPATGALIWESSATVPISGKASPEEQQRSIDQIIAEVLKTFPPPKK